MRRRPRSIVRIAVAFAALACAVALHTPPLSAEPAAESSSGDPPTKIEVFPATVKLQSPRRTQRLVVTGHYPGGRLRDLSREARFSSVDQTVAIAADGVVQPVADGRTQIRVEVGDRKVAVPVDVTGQDNSDPIGFRYETLVALTKQGCNGGACHGSPTGKGGFRLSLQGYDPVLDRITLTREAFGRRTNPFNPDESLLLQKPMMKLSHGGGKRLSSTDPAHQILRTWISEGCRIDPPNAAECLRIEVFPRVRQLKWPAHTQQLCVLAHFSDGTVRDVTPLAVYSSSDDKVATVDVDGLVVSPQRGEAAMVVRYLHHVETASLTFLRDVEGFVWNNPSEANYIDTHVHEKLKLLQIPPSPACSDSEFLRRIYLDVLGILPQRDETEAFLADTATDKRSRLIDDLLERPEYADFWALKWGDLLRVKTSKVTSAGVHKFRRWLVDAIAGNMPYDEFASRLLTASGSTFANPPANYYRAAASTNDCAESTSQLFLGIRIACAKCHNHPFERWTQDNYYGIGAFFNRVVKKETSSPGERVVFTARSGEVLHPRTGQPVKPWLPLVGQIDVDPQIDRRQVFVEWLIRKDNPLFAKVAVNRLWGHLFGRGIVEPVDDFRDSNPPSNAALLDALAADFIAHRFDQKHILRTILQSRAYQRSSRAVPLNASDEKYSSHVRSRLLGAEQLLDAIGHVAEVPQRFRGLPLGTRATQLPSPELGIKFLKVFGQPARESVCQCQRSDVPKLTQALQLINGPIVAGKLKDRRGRLARLLRETSHPASIVGEPPAEGRVLWLRAGSGVLAENGAAALDEEPAAVWQDQSGRELHAEQDDPNHRPLFRAHAVAGRPALQFDGVDDLLHQTEANLVPSGAPRTVLIVAQASTERQGGSVFTFRRSRVAGGAVFTAQHGVYSGTYYVYSDGVNSAGNSRLPNETLPVVQQPFVTTFISAGAGKKLKVRLNGKDQQVVQPGAVGPDGGAAGYTVGSREDVAGFAWPGLVSEVIVYDRVLTAAEQTAAGSYLATKYDLETTYPRLPKPKVEPTKERDLSDRAILDDLYLASYCRLPTQAEYDLALQHLRTIGDRRRALEDICWALLNSKEFLFQH